MRYDWQRNANCWYATINNINYKIGIQRGSGLYDVITSKKRIDSDHFRRILMCYFHGIDESEVEDVIKKIILGVDLRFVA